MVSNFDQVWNREGKVTDFGMKGFQEACRTSPPNFSGSTPLTFCRVWKRWLLWNKWTLLSARKKEIRILITKIAMVGCGKPSLYANESCDEHAIYFRRWSKWSAMYIIFLISGSDVISLESRPLNFRVFIHAYSLLLERYLWSSLTRVLNQFSNK